MYRAIVPAVLLAFLLGVAPSASVAQTLGFLESTENDISSVHADFNNDGREDFIGQTSNCANTDFSVTLSTGDGTYATPVCYALPSGSPIYYAIGDLNSDGNADLIVSNDTSSFYEYLGSSTGALHLQATFITQTTVNEVAAADVNHDGKIDLLFVCDSCGKLNAWFSNGDGGFTTGPTTSVSASGSIFIGDFDADGKADVLLQYTEYGTTDQVLYGNGNGTFTAGAPFFGDTEYIPYDVNGDGISDLIGAPFDFSINGSTYYQYLNVMYGTTTRTFTSTQISLANCTAGPLHPAVADVNGDGTNDIVVVEGADCKGDGPFTFDALLRNPNGSYQPEQVLYTDDTTLIGDPDIFRENQDSKADLALFEEIPPYEPAILFENVTSGNFPGCNPPNKYAGITLCSPTSKVVSSSPVTFNVGAANQTQGRKVELWVDGKKLSENLKDSFSHYSFLDTSYTVANGTHQVTVFAAGWDNILQSQSFSLTVGSSTCAPPSSVGLNVCSPINYATLGTSVLAWAGGKVTGSIARMEVWVDGVKKYSTYGSNALQTTLSLISGYHRFDYYIVNTAGTKWEQTVYGTVQ